MKKLINVVNIPTDKGYSVHFITVAGLVCAHVILQEAGAYADGRLYWKKGDLNFITEGPGCLERIIELMTERLLEYLDPFVQINLEEYPGFNIKYNDAISVGCVKQGAFGVYSPILRTVNNKAAELGLKDFKFPKYPNVVTISRESAFVVLEKEFYEHLKAFFAA